MMLIICDKSPDKAVDWLVENTNKNFCFKQLLELGQLVCSCEISNVYKKINQGKSIQEWIKRNKLWTLRFYNHLFFFWCLCYIHAKPKTFCDLDKIRNDLWDNTEHRKRINYPKSAIFRYKQGYESEYTTNSELPIDIACELYKKYFWSSKDLERKRCDK